PYLYAACNANILDDIQRYMPSETQTEIHPVQCSATGIQRSCFSRCPRSHSLKERWMTSTITRWITRTTSSMDGLAATIPIVWASGSSLPWKSDEAGAPLPLRPYLPRGPLAMDMDNRKMDPRRTPFIDVTNLTNEKNHDGLRHEECTFQILDVSPRPSGTHKDLASSPSAMPAQKVILIDLTASPNASDLGNRHDVDESQYASPCPRTSPRLPREADLSPPGSRSEIVGTWPTATCLPGMRTLGSPRPGSLAHGPLTPRAISSGQGPPPPAASPLAMSHRVCTISIFLVTACTNHL
ncbi:hypothetical protein EJB05_02113, partial [Eragrostis curvula]